MLELTAKQQLHQIIESLSMDIVTELLQMVKQFLTRKELATSQKTILPVSENHNIYFGQAVAQSYEKISWEDTLLNMSAWDDTAIESLHEGRKYINQWQPQQLS